MLLLTGFSSLTSQPRYSATVIIWSTMQSISCVEARNNSISKHSTHHQQHGHQTYVAVEEAIAIGVVESKDNCHGYERE